MSLHYERTELRKTEQQIQNASIKHFPFLRVCIIESQIRYLKVIQNGTLFLLFFAKLFLGSESFCFDFFLSATVGITLSYITNRFSSLLFLPFTMKAIHFLTLWAALTLYGKQTFLYASFLSNICTSNLDLLYIQRKLP